MRAVLGTAGAAAPPPPEVAMMLDLRREAARAPRLEVSLERVSEEDLASARNNWTLRMASEHASARVFGALLAQMMRAGLPASEIHRVAQMAQQELDHGVLCARVLRALGAHAIAELPELEEVPDHGEVSPLEAVLRNVISIGCCSETVAVALVATEREQAGPPALREVLDRILRDEVRHARFGWRLMTTTALDRGLKDGLSEYLHDVFAHQIRFHAPFLEMPCAAEAGLAIGAPHGRSNWAVFLATMNEIVVPGLERCGLGARSAWDEVSRELLRAA
jgi:hypothetical protein